VADQDRGHDRSAALLGKQLGTVRGDQLPKLAEQLVDLTV
jgi:hypothetical protein